MEKKCQSFWLLGRKFSLWWQYMRIVSKVLREKDVKYNEINENGRSLYFFEGILYVREKFAVRGVCVSDFDWKKLYIKYLTNSSLKNTKINNKKEVFAERPTETHFKC